MNVRLSKTFRFEAAHFLPSAPAGTANARVHGHSFRVEATDVKLATAINEPF